MSDLAVVTGASGWLGRRLVEALVRGLPDVPGWETPRPRRIRCLAERQEDVASLGELADAVEWIVGDLRSTETAAALLAHARDGVLFHTAGIIHPRRVRDFYAVNVEGTENMLREAGRAGLRRFIHVSSNSPIGCNPTPEHRFDEQAPFNPYMNYGKSKQLAEEAVGRASREALFETVIIRPPWFYGPGQPARQTTFFQMIKQGKLPLVGGGVSVRSMAYVDNICQGLLLCETVPEATGRTYWIADRRAYPMREVVETVSAVLREDFGLECAEKQLPVPSWVSDVALWADRLIQGVGLYEQRIHVLSEMNKHIACTIQRAQQELGYEPAIELREGMRRSIADLLQRGESL